MPTSAPKRHKASFPIVGIYLGSVDQLAFDPFRGWKAKAVFQEYGEILWEGVLHAPSPDRRKSLTDAYYWAGIFKARADQLNQIKTLPLPLPLVDTARSIIARLLAFHDDLRPDRFAEHFVSYFQRLSDWQRLLRNVVGLREDPCDALEPRHG